MKKLSEFNMKEIKTLIITLKAELKNIMSDDDLRNVLKALADSKNGIKTDITNLDALFTVIDSLLITNEQAFWTILAAFTQSTPDVVQDMNNIEVMQTVVDFLSIEAYKKPFSQVFKSGLNVV